MEGRHKQPQLSLWLLWLDVPIKQVSLDVFHSRDFDFGEACLNGGIKPKIGARELVLLSVSFLRAYVKFSTRLTLLGAGFKKHTLGKWSHLMQTPQESWLLGHQWLVENLTKWHWYCHKNRRPVEAQLANSPCTQGDWAGEFAHKSNEEHFDFTKDREDIKVDTDRICGGNKDIALVWVMLGINHQKGGGSNYFGLGESEFAMLATTQLQIRRISPLCGTSSWRTR